MADEIEIINVKTVGTRVSVGYKFSYGKRGTLHMTGPITEEDIDEQLRRLYERNDPQNLTWTTNLQGIKGKKIDLKAPK